MPLIDPRSLSFEQIKEDLETYVASRSDAATWRDFFSSSAGTILIEMMAGMGAFLSFHATAARREAYLDTANLDTSIYNLAIMLGYPVNRLSCTKLVVTIANGGESICLVPSAGSETLANGTFSYYAVVGTWETETYTATETRDYTRILVSDTGIENVITWATSTFDLLRLSTVNIGAVTILEVVEDLSFTGAALIRTHADGVYLIFGESITVGDIVTFDYVKSAGPIAGDTIPLTSITSLLTPGITITGISIDDRGYLADTIEKIQYTAPGFHAAKKRMVTKEDHIYVFLEETVAISANYIKSPTLCCSGIFSYLLTKQTYAPGAAAQLAAIEDNRMLPEYLTVEDPGQKGVDLLMFVKVTTAADTVTLLTDITAILDTHLYIVGGALSRGTIGKNINLLTGVLGVEIVKPRNDLDLEASVVGGWKLYFSEYNYDIRFVTDDYAVPIVPEWDTGYI